MRASQAALIAYAIIALLLILLLAYVIWFVSGVQSGFEAKISGAQTTYLTDTDHLPFNVIIKNNNTGIVLDTTSKYTTNSSQPAVGRFSLVAGQKYSVVINVTATFSGVGSALIRIRDMDTNIMVGQQGTACNMLLTNMAPNGTLKCTFTAVKSLYHEVQIMAPVKLTSITAASITINKV